MQRCMTVAVVVALLVAPVHAAGPSHNVVWKESAAGFGAGVLVGLAGFTGVSWAALARGAWGGGGRYEAVGFTIMALAPAACATGVSLVGRRYLQHGNFLASLGGSYVGAGAGVGLFALTMRAHSTGGVRNLHYVAAALTPFMMTAGGVAAYNLTRPKRNIQGSIEDRLEMPALGFRPVDAGDGAMDLAADLRLVSLRF